MSHATFGLRSVWTCLRAKEMIGLRAQIGNFNFVLHHRKPPITIMRKTHACLLASLCISCTFALSSPSPTKKTSFFSEAAVRGPPTETKPDYENIVGPLGRPMDTLFLTVFRRMLAQKSGIDSSLPDSDYQGIIEIASKMNREYPDRREVQTLSQEVLRALFPSWLPGSYKVLFSEPFPAFSARMNAWATYVAGTWLMGECEVNDVVMEDGSVAKNQGLLVKRCRFLEESGCASICLNSCKVPTQNFFMQDMGLPLTMEPDYETFECQFSFGKTPSTETEELAKTVPCLSRCPTAGSLRKFHDGDIASSPCKLIE